MPIDVSCKVCGRKIVNLATSHLCDDGSYVGPVCKGKMGGEKVPPMDSLILSNEQIREITDKIYAATRGLNSKERRPIGDKIWAEERNIPWDEYLGNVFESPAHPQAIESINVQELVKFKPIISNHEPKSKYGYMDISSDDIARGVHCYLKLFKDVSLSREHMNLFHNKLGLKLIGIAPSEIHNDGLTDYSNFVITSTKSPYPERALMVSVNNAGWVNFRCLNLLNNAVEASEQSRLPLIIPLTFRRNGGSPEFQLISAFVASVLMMDNPEEQDAFKKYFPLWEAMKSIEIEGDFTFHSRPSTDDYED